MAEGKKSFVLYCDQKEMFEHLPDDMCKKLLLHLFSYVNDDNPKSDDPILNALFAPIKHQLKRDLIKWESRSSTSRANGALGGRPKTQTNPNKPSGLINNPDKPTEPVNATVNANESKTELLIYPTFTDFWDTYDKKVDSRVKAISKWNKFSQDIKEKIIAHVKEYVASTPDKKYRKNPLTYLNNEGWENEIIRAKNNGAIKQTDANAFSQW